MQSRISFSHGDGSKMLKSYDAIFVWMNIHTRVFFLLNILVPGFDPQSYIIDRDMELWSQLHRPMAGNGRYSLIVWSRSSSAKKWWSKAGNSKMGGWVWLKTWCQWTCKMCTIMYHSCIFSQFSHPICWSSQCGGAGYFWNPKHLIVWPPRSIPRSCNAWRCWLSFLSKWHLPLPKCLLSGHMPQRSWSGNCFWFAVDSQ